MTTRFAARYRSARWTAAICCFATAVALVSPTPAFAQDDAVEEDTPSISTVGIAALNGHSTLLSDIDFLGELGGNPGLSGVIQFLSGGALQALDGSRPAGLVVQTDGAAFVPIVCLPIDDIDKLLEVGENFNLEPLDAGNGVYELELPDQVLYFQQKGDWTFAAQSVEALAMAPADTASLLDPLVKTYDLGVKLAAGAVPPMYREIALEQLRQGMEQGLQQGPEESDEEFEARRQMAQTQVEQIKDLIEGLDQLLVGWSIDSENRQTFLDIEFTGVEGTDMALAMSTYTESTTGITGFHRPKAAGSFLAHGTTPPELLEKQEDQIDSVVEMTRSQLRKGIRESQEMLSDPDLREAIEAAADDLVDVYEQMLRDGSVELAGSVDLAGDGFDAILAASVSDPEKVESAFKKIADAAAENENFPGVEWGFASHSGVTMHGMSLPVPAEGQAREVFGETLRVVMGVGEERVYLGVGPRCESALKEAIDRSTAMSNEKVLPAELIISVKQMLTAFEKVAPPQSAPVVGMVLDALEDAPEGKAKVVVTVSGIERGGRIRYLLEEGVLTAIGKSIAAAAQMQAGGPPGGF